MTKIAVAKGIFTGNVSKLQNGDYKKLNELRPYKAFRQSTIDAIVAANEVSKANAAQVFNVLRTQAVEANPLLTDVLKRDKALGRQTKAKEAKTS